LAFCDCSSLTSVYCKAATPPSLGDDVFKKNVFSRKIYVPKKSAKLYKRAAGWEEYWMDIKRYDFNKQE
jgi:hypothetical protein